MFNRFKSSAFVLLVVLLCTMLLTHWPSVNAQEKPTGKLLVWMQVANQDQLTKTILPDFLKEYPGITVEFVNYSPTEVANQLLLAIQGGTGAPDVALMETAQIARVVDLGGLVDLTEHIAPYMSDLPEWAQRLGKKDDRYYSFVWDTGPVVLYYRRDIFKAAGLSDDPAEVDKLVSTWDKFLEVCKTIKEKTQAACFAQNKANNYGDVWANMLWQQGLGWYTDDGKVTVDTPEGVAALEKLGEFWKADVVSDDPEWTDQWYASLNMPKLDDANVKPVATIPIAGWMGGFLTNWAAKDTNGLWGVARMPAYTEGGVRAANQGGSSYVIPAQTQNVEAAWAFLDYINSTKAQIALFSYGDIFPARFSTYTDPVFSEKLAYFADQPVREVYIEAAKIIPVANIYGVYYSVMNGATDLAIQKFATGQMSAQDALTEAANTIRQETGLQ